MNFLVITIIFFIIIIVLTTDDAFSTETGLERAGFARPVSLLWTLDSSAKIRNKKDQRGLARCLSDA